MFTVLILISFIPAVISFSLLSCGLRFDVMLRSAARNEVPYEVAMQGRRAGLEKLVPYEDATDKEAWEEAMRNRDSRLLPRAFGYHQVAPKEAFHVGEILIPALKMVDVDALPDQHNLRIDVNDDGLVHPRSKLLRGIVHSRLPAVNNSQHKMYFTSQQITEGPYFTVKITLWSKL